MIVLTHYTLSESEKFSCITALFGHGTTGMCLNVTPGDGNDWSQASAEILMKTIEFGSFEGKDKDEKVTKAEFKPQITLSFKNKEAFYKFKELVDEIDFRFRLNDPTNQ